MSTKIEWVTNLDGTKGETWNPITGCTKISEGCKNCYAERMSKRLAGRCGYPKENPFQVTLHPDKLDQPLKWKKPRMIFVCSMGDILHQDVEPIMFVMVLNIIKKCPQHTFLMLTKRPGRMIDDHLDNTMIIPYFQKPMPNLWWGVTAENQQRADERIPILLQIPAAKRFVSVEPMLSEVDLTKYLKALDWVICGTESGGKRRRPAKEEWIRQLRFQCVYNNIPFFLKQMEVNGQLVKMPELDGQIYAEYPEVSR